MRVIKALLRKNVKNTPNPKNIFKTKGNNRKTIATFVILVFSLRNMQNFYQQISTCLKQDKELDAIKINFFMIKTFHMIFKKLSVVFAKHSIFFFWNQKHENTGNHFENARKIK